MGERCSGTKFLVKLICDNLPLLELTFAYGHKHFIPWLDTPLDDATCQRLSRRSAKKHFAGSNHCLFIIIIRDPYDWLRSFLNTPYHVSGYLTESFSDFISKPWSSYEPHLEFFENINPWTEKPFSTVLELRNFKNRNYLHVSRYVKNFIIIRYEDVRDYPLDFINFLSKTYNLQKASAFIPADCYVGHDISYEKFFKKSYFTPSNEEINWINAHLNWDVENQLGYVMKTKL